jgi:hypothetical protein
LTFPTQNVIIARPRTPVVKRISRRPPEPEVRVRVPAGVPDHFFVSKGFEPLFIAEARSASAFFNNDDGNTWDVVINIKKAPGAVLGASAVNNNAVQATSPEMKLTPEPIKSVMFREMISILSTSVDWMVNLWLKE